MMPMGRCGVVALVVLAIAGSAAATPLREPCDCKEETRPVPRDGAVVPRNAKLWVLDQAYDSVQIQRVDSARHDAIPAEWDPKLGASVYTPTSLVPGRYAVSYERIPAGTFEVVDEIDTTPPARPELDRATLEIDAPRGRVDHLSVVGRFDRRDTAVIRITLDDGESHQILATTLDRLELCEPPLKTSAKSVRLTVEAIDYAGNVSPATTLELATTPSSGLPCIDHHYGCGLGAAAGLLVGFILLMFVLCATAIAVFRRIHRGTSGEPPILVPNLVATALAKHARTRDGVVLVIVIGAVVAALSFFGEWASVGGVWALIRFSDYIVASRALALLDNGLAIAELYGTNLVVRHAGKQSAVLLSRGEIRDAHRAAVPTAKMT